MTSKQILAILGVAAVASASAEVMDRPTGIKIGEHLTLRPYVSLSYTYDSNPDSSKHSTKDGSQWLVNPGLGAEYLAENWKLAGAAWYEYHAYNRYSSQLNSSSFGEQLQFDWADSMPNEKGWKVMFSEKFQQIAQDDDMSNDGGRGIGRDRKQLTASGIVERRINEYVHGAIDASYYLLDYDNDVDKYASLYGWKRTTVGGELGYAPSKWTDFIVAASYQWYDQDNSHNRNGETSNRISSSSKGWSVMGGIGTRATERIEYRVLAGWSRFEYGGGAKDSDGFVYEFSGKWKITDTLNFMALGTSYYHPSEREYSSQTKVYSASAGLAKSFVRGKVTGTLDFAYRHEDTEYVGVSGNDYDQDIWTGRIGVNYVMNRFFTVFARAEYQDCEKGGSGAGHYSDYDRFRGTIGMRLTY